MRRKILKAKHETVEFLIADSCLAGGGFLIGADLINSPVSAYAGGLAVATGLFLGLRVLWKFSSELKGVKTQINITMKNLKQTNKELQTNAKLLECK